MSESIRLENVATVPKVTVLICTFNEEENLVHVLPEIPDWIDEILLVDARSADRTIEVARQMTPRCRVLYQPGKGKGDALRHGIENAANDIIVTLDADGATDPKYLPQFIKPLLEGYDVTKGSRFAIDSPDGKVWYRILGNWIIAWTFNVLFFRHYTDLCSGYNGFRKNKVAAALNPWTTDGYENEPFMNSRMARRKLRVKEIGYHEVGRMSGEVKEKAWRQGFKAIKSIVRERCCGG